MPLSAAPASAHDVAATALASAPTHRRQTFALRLDRWWDDLLEPLVRLHGAQEGRVLATQLVALAAAAYGARDDELHLLDERRLLEPDWLQSPRMLGYATYADRFGGTLEGVGEQVPYLEELGVTYLHLMPLLLPREGDNDGGYAVADYTRVRPDLGSMDDLRALATTLRRRGISLVLDLVLNHVAREHAWAVAARAGDAVHRDYFHIFDDRGGPQGPDAYECTLPEVFPDFAPGNFTWDDGVQGWVWTTFNSWQWDVNWANPAVMRDYAEIVLDLANTGVEVLRLDAIAFMWKRLGTNCQNQPEVHDITQVLRTLARIACPATVFKAEAIVAPRDLLAYLGAGGYQGKVSDLAYHNSLMVQIWSMLATGDVRLTAHALRGCRPHRPDRPGSPTCAATTTSAGRSTTPTPPSSGSTGGRTDASSRSGMPGPSPGRRPAAWSSRRTRRPVTGASAAPLPSWPGWPRPAPTVLRPRVPWPGSCWLTR